MKRKTDQKLFNNRNLAISNYIFLTLPKKDFEKNIYFRLKKNLNYDFFTTYSYSLLQKDIIPVPY